MLNSVHNVINPSQIGRARCVSAALRMPQGLEHSSDAHTQLRPLLRAGDSAGVPGAPRMLCSQMGWETPETVLAARQHQLLRESTSKGVPGYWFDC